MLGALVGIFGGDHTRKGLASRSVPYVVAVLEELIAIGASL